MYKSGKDVVRGIVSFIIPICCFGGIASYDEYYGDNKEDHKYVKKGIELFYEDYPKEKA